MIKRFFTRWAHRIFFHLKKGYDIQNSINRNIFLKSVCILGSDTIVSEDATIHNDIGDNTKILIGDNCWVRGDLLLFNHGGEIQIGNHCFIGTDTKIWSAKKITIGNRVLISHNVNIHDNNSHSLDHKLRHEDFIHILASGLQKTNNLREAEINIGDDVWIGFNCIILKGVKIGKCAIIGAGTTIIKDVPDYAVVAGNPARIIKYLQQNTNV